MEQNIILVILVNLTVVKKLENKTVAILVNFIQCYILGDPEVTAYIYCKTRNLPNTNTQNYSTHLR